MQLFRKTAAVRAMAGPRSKTRFERLFSAAVPRALPNPARMIVKSHLERVPMDERRSSYEYEDLLACGRGELFREGPQLPLPPMLMFDRITEVAEAGGEYGKGLIRAVLNVKPDLWFFPCHFKGDPVMPGCLGLDALWQMVGFFLGWLGSSGRGRAIGVGEVKLAGQVRPDVKEVVYGVDIKRGMRSKLVLRIEAGRPSDVWQ